MNKDIKYFGIDISHLVFDVTDSDGKYYQFKNNEFGFKKVFETLKSSKSLCDRSYRLLPLLVGLSFIRIGYNGFSRKPIICKTFYTD